MTNCSAMNHSPFQCRHPMSGERLPDKNRLEQGIHVKQCHTISSFGFAHSTQARHRSSHSSDRLQSTRIHSSAFLRRDLSFVAPTRSTTQVSAREAYYRSPLLFRYLQITSPRFRADFDFLQHCHCIHTSSEHIEIHNSDGTSVRFLTDLRACRSSYIFLS